MLPSRRSKLPLQDLPLSYLFVHWLTGRLPHGNFKFFHHFRAEYPWQEDDGNNHLLKKGIIAGVITTSNSFFHHMGSILGSRFFSPSFIHRLPVATTFSRKAGLDDVIVLAVPLTASTTSKKSRVPPGRVFIIFSSLVCGRGEEKNPRTNLKLIRGVLRKTGNAGTKKLGFP
jgi:hypothetical protein